MKLFKDLPDKDTAINAENLNQIQNNLTIVSPTEPTGDNREKVWIQKGKNWFKPEIPHELGSCRMSLNNDTVSAEALASDMYIGQVVTEGDNYNANVGQLIPVAPNSEVTVSCTNAWFNNFFITSYNEDKVSLGYVNSRTILTSNDTKYISIRYGVNPANIGETYSTQVQVEQGPVATAYEPYVEKKILVKNDNEVYEEIFNLESRYKLLWRNNEPNSAFVGGDMTGTTPNITLLDGDYDLLIWLYTREINKDYVASAITPKGYGGNLGYVSAYGEQASIFREVLRVDDTNFVISHAFNGSTQHDDNLVIPILVYGIKF